MSNDPFVRIVRFFISLSIFSLLIFFAFSSLYPFVVQTLESTMGSTMSIIGVSEEDGKVAFNTKESKAETGVFIDSKTNSHKKSKEKELNNIKIKSSDVIYTFSEGI